MSGVILLWDGLKQEGRSFEITHSCCEIFKKLYIDTYKERLENRNMKPELMDVYFLKSELWKYRNEELVKKQSNPWTNKELETVLKSLKITNLWTQME